MKDCWWWSHDWTRWSATDAYRLAPMARDSVVESGIVQSRHCVRCGLMQTQRVKDGTLKYAERAGETPTAETP